MLVRSLCGHSDADRAPAAWGLSLLHGRPRCAPLTHFPGEALLFPFHRLGNEVSEQVSPLSKDPAGQRGSVFTFRSRALTTSVFRDVSHRCKCFPIVSPGEPGATAEVYCCSCWASRACSHPLCVTMLTHPLSGHKGVGSEVRLPYDMSKYRAISLPTWQAPAKFCSSRTF